MGAKTKVFAVSAITLGGIAGATGTAYAAQGGVATEAPSGTTTAVAEKSKSSTSVDAKTKAASTKQKSTEVAKASSPAPTISQAEKSQPRSTSGGGQGGVTTELPAESKSEKKTEAKAEPRAVSSGAEAQETGAPAPQRASTSDNESARSNTTNNDTARDTSVPTRSTPTQQAAPAQQTSSGTTSQQASTTPTTQQASSGATAATATQTPASPASQASAQQDGVGYNDVAAATGQGGVVTELPAADPKPADDAADAVADDATVEATADDSRTDYTERVEAASQTPSSDSFVPADPATNPGQVTTYTAPRDNGAEVGASNGDVATGTAVQVSDTTSYISNTTTGGGEQATAAQTWDSSNGNYNATWATTGGVSGTGGFSATNEQTAPNVGTAGVDGQWASPDGASSVTVTGGATLQNYGVHDASGSVEINTPIGNMSFAF